MADKASHRLIITGSISFESDRVYWLDQANNYPSHKKTPKTNWFWAYTSIGVNKKEKAA